jgi:hypothetical protein
MFNEKSLTSKQRVGGRGSLVGFIDQVNEYTTELIRNNFDRGDDL